MSKPSEPRPSYNAADDVEQPQVELARVSEPVRRRRGACQRCRARKVRCDGKSSCSQCQRLGYQCLYLRSVHRRPTSLKSIGVRTPVSLAQSEAPTNYGSTQCSPEGVAFRLSTSALFEDIFTAELPADHQDDQDDTVVSFAAEYPTRMSTFPSGTEGSFIVPTYDDIFTDLDLSTHAAIGEQYDNEMQSGTQVASTTTYFSSIDDDSTGDMHTVTQLSSTLGSPFESRRNNPVVFGSASLNSIYTDKITQLDLTKDALLEDIQEHCNQWRGPQSEDLSHSFKKLVSGGINICPPRANGISIENGKPLHVHQKFAFDCIDACLKDSQGVSTFLDRASLERSMSEILEQPALPVPRQALAQTILALGAHLLRAQDRPDMPRDSGHDPRVYFSVALKLKSGLMERGFSLRNFQALITMTYFAFLIGSHDTSDLLSSSIHYAQIMRLGRSITVDRLCETTIERQQAKRTLWFLYSMEKAFCLRAEIFPLLDEDFVDYKPPKCEGPSAEVDWLFIHCRYASVCTAVLKGFYGQRSLQNQDPNSTSDLEDRLHDWVKSLPIEIQSIQNVNEAVDFAAMSSQERWTKLRLFFQYHEALLAIHTRRRPQHSTPGTPEYRSWLLSSDQKSALSVKKILMASCQLTASDVRSYPTLYRVVCIATCSLAAATIRNHGDRRDLSYLATAAGFFGRMALADIEGPLEEITEIVRIAQQSIKGRQQSKTIGE